MNQELQGNREQIIWRLLAIQIIGTTPLIVHNYSRELPLAKGADAAFERARFLDEKGADCIPACWIKIACVEAARYVEGVKITELRGALRIDGDLVPLRFAKMRRRADVVYGPAGAKDYRYRPEYSRWSVRCRALFRKDMLTCSSVISLLNNAGKVVGLGDLRPGQNGNSYGMFEAKLL